MRDVQEMGKIGVAVLGATGMVGQRFIELLEDHPFFELRALSASERSAGRRYGEAAKWYLASEIPEGLADMKVVRTDPNDIPKELDISVAFSALPADIARKVEADFAGAGYVVASNASSFRKEPDVPLLIPEINPDHLALVDVQRKKRNWDGCIVTNPNCSTIGLAITLKPIYDEFGIKNVIVTTLQAVSGAGYDGVPSMAIVDNVIPYISNEEDKVELESNKILGTLKGEEIENAPFTVSAACNRVAVLDGHTECVSIETEKDVSPELAKKAFAQFRGEPQKLNLPSAPAQPIEVTEDQTRPQPRFDRDKGPERAPGMTVTVGRVREDSVFKRGFKYVLLSHNTVRGAAGASILNAELMHAKKML